jgi:alkylation response protein AidB-like acyl-CoA dehydrogenase
VLLDLDEERSAFRDAIRSWVNKNFPKTRAIELEKQEYQYPFELWHALTDAGYHAIGIGGQDGGQDGDTVDTSILTRELARNLGGLTWTWAISSFAGAKAIVAAAGICRFLDLVAVAAVARDAREDSDPAIALTCPHMFLRYLDELNDDQSARP